MRYHDIPELDSLYRLVGALYEIHDRPEDAMTITDALVTLGEERTWASVWWAYGAVRHDLSDEAYDRALRLLARVEHPAEAQAAALMLSAEIELTKALQTGEEPNLHSQVALLSRAVTLAPEWPSLHVRLAQACAAAQRGDDARRRAQQAMQLLERREVSDDPYDVAFTGRGPSTGYVFEELHALGLL